MGLPRKAKALPGKIILSEYMPAGEEKRGLVYSIFFLNSMTTTDRARLAIPTN
jgi:hypothetical protein